MLQLYYTSEDKTAFWIIGTNNIHNVNQNIIMLKKFAKLATNILNVDTDDVCSFHINESSQFKQMRVFYCVTNTIPEKAVVLDNISMENFIRE